MVFDKFHVSKHLGEAVDKVRRQEHKQLRAAGDERLPGPAVRVPCNDRAPPISATSACPRSAPASRGSICMGGPVSSQRIIKTMPTVASAEGIKKPAGRFFI